MNRAKCRTRRLRLKRIEAIGALMLSLSPAAQWCWSVVDHPALEHYRVWWTTRQDLSCWSGYYDTTLTCDEGQSPVITAKGQVVFYKVQSVGVGTQSFVLCEE